MNDPSVSLDHLCKLQFKQKVVVVTGGSSGIGQQLAQDLVVLGAQVVACSSNSSALTRTQREFEKIGLKIDTQECDVRYNDQIDHLADYVLKKYRYVDVLVNNAGYAVYRPFEESSLLEILDLLDVNLAGAMRLTKAFLPSMIARRSGRIVNISSLGGETIITPNAVYCAAKHGMVAWTKALRYELALFNIKVNVVCPGHTKTNFHDHLTFRRRDPYRRKNARSLAVDQVSAAVLDAISKDRVVTYVPWWQGLVVWSLNAFSLLTKPVWDRISQKRVDQLYEQIEKERRKGEIR